RAAREELGHDIELLGKLRRLIVERLRAEKRPFSMVEVFESKATGLRASGFKVLDGDLLELGAQGQGAGSNGRATVDVLSLSTSTLRSFLASEPGGVKLALGVLEVHRGEDPEPDLKPILDKVNAAQHRVAWFKQGKDARDAGLNLLENVASEEW